VLVKLEAEEKAAAWNAT